MGLYGTEVKGWKICQGRFGTQNVGGLRQEKQVEDRYGAREDLLLGRDGKFEQGAAEGVSDRVHEFSAVHEGLPWVFKARVDQVESQKDFADVIHVVELSVQVFALQKLAELVEDQESIASMWLVCRAWT